MEYRQHIHPYEQPLRLVGVNHRTLSVDHRELIASLDTSSVLKELSSDQGVETAILSTCNRFEILSIGAKAVTNVVDRFSDSIGQDLPFDSIYSYQDSEAVRHFFRVASSLDSMVLGEPQILGQVKNAYEQAKERGSLGPQMHRLFQFAFRTAKKVRLNTGISENAVSVSYLAVRLAEQVFGDLSQRSALVIGSGETAELAVLHLKSRGCGDIIIANRTVNKAAVLAERVGGTAIGLDRVSTVLDKVDIVFGSIQIDRPVLRASSLASRDPRNAMLLIDLGVPRNFAPLLGERDGVYLYNVDDLERLADENRNLRKEAASDAEIIVEHGLFQFERWLQRFSMQPELVDIRSRVQGICEAELRKSLKSHTNLESVESVIPELSRSLGRKLAHDVTKVIEEHSGSDLELTLSKLLEDELGNS